jgi:hypothetical protein
MVTDVMDIKLSLFTMLSLVNIFIFSCFLLSLSVRIFISSPSQVCGFSLHEIFFERRSDVHDADYGDEVKQVEGQSKCNKGGRERFIRLSLT